jgi:hypothetical protein
LSIASYRTSTSPSDQNNQNVLAWLNRLTSSHQSSIKAAGGTIGSKAFKIDPRKHEVSDSDSDQDGVTTVRERDDTGGIDREDKYAGTSIVGGDENSENSENDEVDKTSALPDVSVPLGLIANLSLSNSSGNNRRKKTDDDDDDVVSAYLSHFDEMLSLYFDRELLTRDISNLV